MGDLGPPRQRVDAALRRRLDDPKTCSELVDYCEELLRSVWSFCARLLGDDGARSVLERSVMLASRKEPLVRKVRVSKGGVDLAELRAHLVESGCDPTEGLRAFAHLGMTIFATLTDLTGDILTAPLLRRLEESPRQGERR